MTDIGVAMLTVAVVGAMPPSIIASLALWQVIQNGRKANVAVQSAQASVANAEASVLEATEKTAQIHADTNGNLARMRAELKAANDRIDALLARLDKESTP